MATRLTASPVGCEPPDAVLNSDPPGDDGREREHELHSLVPAVRDRLEHQRTATGDHAYSLLPPVDGGRTGNASPPTKRCIQTCLIPSSAHSRIVASVVSGLVLMTTAVTPPGIDLRSG